VHAFATDPKRGIFILAFLALVVGGSLVLFALRGHRLAGAAQFDPVSREGLLLGNNVLLLVAAASVALGTLYPLALDALGAGKISVGPPYFEAVFVPVVAPMLFLMGAGPLAAWKRARLPELGARLKWAAGVSMAAALLLPFAAGWRPMVALGLFLAFWIAASSITAWLERRRARTVPLASYGMLIAHLGMAVFIAGVTLVKAYESTEEVRMAVGDSARLAGYDFRFASIEEVRGPNYTAARGAVEVTRGDAALAKLHPEKRLYMAQSMPMTEAALDMGFLRHLYVALGEPLSEREWLVRLQHKPFVGWIWLGALLMALGGALAAFRASRP
jgi:cytochrome c-type biogenesis protein CcmF